MSANILIGTPPPENGVAGRVAFKTGTSYGYRDAWSVGFDGRYTIGVWVGRPDGAPVPGLVGRDGGGADPVRCLRPAAGRSPHRLPRAPSGVLLTTSAKLPPPLKFFQPAERRRRRGGEAPHPVSAGWRPARFDRGRDEKPAPVPLKITGGIAPLTILVNGVPAPAQSRAGCSFSRRPGLCPRHGDRRFRRGGQRDGAAR